MVREKQTLAGLVGSLSMGRRRGGCCGRFLRHSLVQICARRLGTDVTRVHSVRLWRYEVTFVFDLFPPLLSFLCDCHPSCVISGSASWLVSTFLTSTSTSTLFPSIHLQTSETIRLDGQGRIQLRGFLRHYRFVSPALQLTHTGRRQIHAHRSVPPSFISSPSPYTIPLSRGRDVGVRVIQGSLRPPPKLVRLWVHRFCRSSGSGPWGEVRPKSTTEGECLWW